MATTNPPPANLGSDVQIIREILFGEQFDLLRQRIESLEEAVVALQKENTQLLKSLKAEAAERQRGDRQGSDRLEALETRMNEQGARLSEQFNSQIAAESKSHGQALSELDRRLSKRLEQIQADFTQIFTEHQKLEQGLVGRLAQALTGYQNSDPVSENSENTVPSE